MPVCILSCKWSQILCDPVNCSPQAPLSMGFSRQKYWNGLPFLSLGDLLCADPHLLHWQVNSLPLSHPGSQLLEKCKSKLEWGSTSHWSEWPSLKTLPTTSAGKGVVKRSPVTLLMGMLIGTASVENPQKTKNRVVIWSSSPTLGHILRTLNLKRYMHPYVR